MNNVLSVVAFCNPAVGFPTPPEQPGTDAEASTSHKPGGETEASQGAASSLGAIVKALTPLELLTKSPGLVLDHKSLIHQTSCQVNDLKSLKEIEKSKEDLIELKEKLNSAKDIEDLVGILYDDKEASNALFLMLNDVCLAEVANIDSSCGPLSDFPPNINKNVYSSIVEFGLSNCPHTMSFLVNLVTCRNKAVTTNHVLRVATLFASVCYMKNHNLDGLAKLRSLTLQVGGLTNQQLDAMADLGLAQTSRAMCDLRDIFAELGPQVMLGASSGLPEQSTIDNLDFAAEHMS